MRYFTAAAAVLLLAAPAAAQLLPFPRMRTLDPIPVAAGDEAGPQALTLADLNADGLPELIVIDRDEDRVAILLGRGDGSFEAARIYDLDGTPTAVAVADLSSPFGSDAAGDIDGKVDLVITYEDGYADLLLGRGDGDFDPPEQDLGDELGSGELIGIAVGDFDGNDRDDLALLDAFEELYFLCNVNGNLAPCLTELVETMGDGALAIAGGDFDGDTNLDLAVLNLDSRNLSPVFGNGDGSFDEVTETISTSAEGDQPPSALAAARLDSDPRDDLVVANYDLFLDFGLLGLYGRPAHAFTRRLFVSPFGMTALALADLGGDAILDVVTIAGEQGGGIFVMSGDGTGGFVDPVLAIGSPSATGRAVATGDLNGDGRTDVVYLNTDGSLVQVALNVTIRCAGDCDDGGVVSIDELIRAVSIALDGQDVSACVAVDTNGNTQVEINELIAAVARALGGCPA